MIVPFCIGLLNIACAAYGFKTRMRWETWINVVSAVICIGGSLLVWSRR